MIILFKFMVVFLLSFMAGFTTIYAGTWNDKPVICADKEEAMEVVLSKNEKLIFEGKMMARVYDQSGIAETPAKIPFLFYANLGTGSFTVFEFHPSYKTWCMLAHGEDVHAFTETL